MSYFTWKNGTLQNLFKRGSTEWFCHPLLFARPSLLITSAIQSAVSTPPFPFPLFLPPPSVTIFQVFTEENSAECSSAGDSGAEHQVPKLSLLEVVHIRTISASGDLISLQQEDGKFSKQLEKGKVRW